MHYAGVETKIPKFETLLLIWVSGGTPLGVTMKCNEICSIQMQHHLRVEGGTNASASSSHSLNSRLLKFYQIIF